MMNFLIPARAYVDEEIDARREESHSKSALARSLMLYFIGRRRGTKRGPYVSGLIRSGPKRLVPWGARRSLR